MEAMGLHFSLCRSKLRSLGGVPQRAASSHGRRGRELSGLLYENTSPIPEGSRFMT